MSVEQKNIIDYVSVRDGKKVLTVSDHLQWNDIHHLYALQEKINMYISAIETGQLSTMYPEATKGYVIQLYLQYEPDEQGLSFLKKIGHFLAEHGSDFEYGVLKN